MRQMCARPGRRRASSRRDNELMNSRDSGIVWRDLRSSVVGSKLCADLQSTGRSGRIPECEGFFAVDGGLYGSWPGAAAHPPAPCTGGHRKLTDIEAHITGTVWKIEVEVGDTVEEGDAVVILESMKMEMPVEAEDPGVVSEIRCSEGQSVSEGDTLVVLE